MSTKAEATKHLDIWDKVEKTDPAFTKPFNRTGGFRGTATNATYLAKRATEVFGPMGIGWGLEVISEEVLEGAFIDDRNREAVHKVHVRLWYKHAGEIGNVQHFGQTTFVGRNKFGTYTDEEAPKKSLTDAMSKCLSMLGFSADIHLGRYDDNKYVEQVRTEVAEAQRAEQPKITDEQATELGDMLVESGANQKGFLDFFRIKQIVDLPAGEFAKAKSILAKKLAQRDAA